MQTVEVYRYGSLFNIKCYSLGEFFSFIPRIFGFERRARDIAISSYSSNRRNFPVVVVVVVVTAFQIVMR